MPVAWLLREASAVCLDVGDRVAISEDVMRVLDRGDETDGAGILLLLVLLDVRSN